MKKTGGQAVVAALQAHDVKPVFGMPGVHNLALYDAPCDAPEIRHVVVRHEQGAGFAADGYANRRTSSRSAASAMNSTDSSTCSKPRHDFARVRRTLVKSVRPSPRHSPKPSRVGLD